MTMQSSIPGRWAGALALSMGATLTFDNVAFGPLGVLALPLAVYAAANATGWARKDAAAIAAASSLVGFFGMFSAGHVSTFLLVTFGLVTVAALRPRGRRDLAYRIALLLVWFLVALRMNAWWTILLVPPIVAAADELARLTASSVAEISPAGGVAGHLEPAIAGAGQSAWPTSAEDDGPAQRRASAALALASLACLLLVGFGFFATTGSIVPLLVTFVSAAGGAVLAIRSLRTDPIRATTALLLAAIPLAFVGFLFLIALSGGLKIGE